VPDDLSLLISEGMDLVVPKTVNGCVDHETDSRPAKDEKLGGKLSPM
jgi:hypothetical protein